jgi:hypothetical protein
MTMIKLFDVILPPFFQNDLFFFSAEGGLRTKKTVSEALFQEVKITPTRYIQDAGLFNVLFVEYTPARHSRFWNAGDSRTKSK